jgi:hypothetical protein
VDFHRKRIKNSWQDWVAGEPQPADKKNPEIRQFPRP